MSDNHPALYGDVTNDADPGPAERVKRRQGFAAMDPEKRREIARKGGASVPAYKRSFSKYRDLAADAGRKGGSTSRGGGRKPASAPAPAATPNTTNILG